MLSVTPDRNTVYRFTYAGDSRTASAQAEVQVQVRRTVTFVGAGSSVSRARVGRSVRIVAEVRPVTPVASLSFRLYRYNTVRRQWVYAGSRGRGTDAAGRASLTWTPTSPGSYYWRVTVAATTDHAASVSAVYRWSVTR